MRAFSREQIIGLSLENDKECHIAKQSAKSNWKFYITDERKHPKRKDKIMIKIWQKKSQVSFDKNNKND